MRIHPLHIFGLLLIGACQTIQFDQPLSTSELDWLVDGQSQERTRIYDLNASLPLELEWEYNAAAAFGPGSPLILDGVVLAATRKGEVHTVDLQTGRKRGFKSFSDGIEGPLAIANGKMFVASALGKKKLIAWNLRRGNALWKYKGAAFESGLVVFENLVIGSDVDGVVTAFDQDSGLVVWSLKLGEMVSVQSTPLLLSGGRLFVADDASNAFLIAAATGDVLWERRLPGPVYESASASAGRIFVPTTRGVLVALDEQSGHEIWTLTHDLNTARFGAVATDGERVFVGATDGQLRAIDATNGEVVWNTIFPDVIAAAPLIAGDVVFVGSMGKMLYGVNRKTGALEWHTELKGRVKSAIAASSSGIIVLSEPRYISYFKSLEGPDAEKE